MALDFHLAKNKNEAPYKNASASFELQSHETIFYQSGLPDGKFPLFRRMEDYFKDASYGCEELHNLILEIQEIKNLFGENGQVSDQLESILAACKKARDEKLSIWIYCD